MFSKHYEIVDKAGPDVMRFKVANTAVQVQAKDLEAYHYIPVMLVATGAAEVAGLYDTYWQSRFWQARRYGGSL